MRIAINDFSFFEILNQFSEKFILNFLMNLFIISTCMSCKCSLKAWQGLTDLRQNREGKTKVKQIIVILLLASINEIRVAQSMCFASSLKFIGT